MDLPPLLIRSLSALARSQPGGALLRWSFATMNAILPLDRIRETDRLVAFYHPKPAYPTHVLIVPKQAVKSLLDLAPKDRDLLAEVV
ncbi:MAG TPA: HIT domain-containing protein, partial [Anaerolineaceae bacterium]|nr:HIT domain-containing protein [Anaerolineaceae bacterium]